MNLADRYRQWFAYEQESHAQVLASLEAVPDPLRPSSVFQQAAALLAHLVAARELWLFRLGVGPESPSEVFPPGVPLPTLAQRVAAMEVAWPVYLSRLDEAALGRRFAYQSLEGSWYRNTVEDILTQLFGHAWYHRGQIAALLRSLGGEPAVTDSVLWIREPIPPPEGA